MLDDSLGSGEHVFQYNLLRFYVALERLSHLLSPLPANFNIFRLLQELRKMQYKMPYLFITTPLNIRSIIWACHWQNRQLASISPRSTTWPFDLASASGFTCLTDQGGGRWHIFAPCVSIKNESDATKSDVVITCIMRRRPSQDLQYCKVKEKEKLAYNWVTSALQHKVKNPLRTLRTKFLAGLFERQQLGRPACEYVHLSFLSFTRGKFFFSFTHHVPL